MSLKNKKIQKFVSVMLLVAVLAPSFAIFSAPRKAEATGIPTVDVVGAVLSGIGNTYSFLNAAVDTQSAALSLKGFARETLRMVLQNIAKRALANMTKSTINWINTGFHGAPLFLQNPNSFFRDIAKFQIKDFIQVTGYDNLRYPFGKQFALDLIGSYKQQLGANAQSSLAAVTDDPLLAEKLRLDFNTGGWDAFLLNTQYPQNNPIGYQQIAGRDLSVRLDGVIKGPAERVNEALAQGQGFLSPKTCDTNPRYNNGVNEFNRPNFKTTIAYNPPEVEYVGNTDTVSPEYERKLATYNTNHSNAVEAQRTEWAKENECEGGLRVTTPGSVAQDYIARTLFSGQEQGQLSAALGNSISAVFDSLLNKFLGDGLSSLASRINPSAPVDDFSYFGQTLGSPADEGYNSDWSLGPDEEVDLSLFKRELSGGDVTRTASNGTTTTERVAGAIEMTEQELKIIFNDGKTPNGTTNSNNFGIIQIMDLTWPVVKDLDMCIPGPNKGWEGRLDEERDRIINGKLIREVASDDDTKVKATNSAIRDLRFAISSFKDWINTQMMSSLPSAVIYMDTIKSIDDNGQQLKQLNDKKVEKTTTLARLRAIERGLATITIQPTPGSAEEKNLIALRKQYNAIAYLVGNTASVEDLRSELDLARSKLQNIREQEATCQTERTAAGWAGPLNYNQGYLPSKVGITYIVANRIPKQGVVFPVTTIPFTTKGTEIEQFCDLPALSGYSHGDIVRVDDSNRGKPPFTFRNLINQNGYLGFEDLPMVKAFGIYGDDTRTFDPIDVDIECSILFKTNDQTYKRAGEQGY